MDAGNIQTFLYSPYNKVADVKMYFFFAEMSLFAFVVILLLALFSDCSVS